MFQKQYYCKHWLGVAVQKKLVAVSQKSSAILFKPSRGRPTDFAAEELSQRPKGHPAKIPQALAVDNNPVVKRGRGRPPKKRQLSPTLDTEIIQEPPKKKLGRPRIRPLSPTIAVETAAPQAKRKRGRPKISKK